MKAVHGVNDIVNLGFRNNGIDATSLWNIAQVNRLLLRMTLLKFPALTFDRLYHLLTFHPDTKERIISY